MSELARLRTDFVRFALGIKMTAPLIMTMVLMAADDAMALIALVFFAIITATALGTTTIRLQCVAASTASTIVVARFLLTVLLSRVVSLVLVLVLVNLLVLELHRPVTSKVVTEFVRIQRIVGIERNDFLVVHQSILHLFGEKVPNKLYEFSVSNNVPSRH